MKKDYRTKSTDRLKSVSLLYSCLRDVTFIKSPVECSNSNLVHQHNTIKQLIKLHFSTFSLLLFQHNFPFNNFPVIFQSERDSLKNGDRCKNLGCIRSVRTITGVFTCSRVSLTNEFRNTSNESPCIVTQQNIIM